MQTLKRTLPILSAVLLLVLVAACSSASASTANPTVVPATPTAVPPAAAGPTSNTKPASASAPAVNEAISGASLYQLSCAACHGEDRAGKKVDQDGKTISVPELTWDELNKMYQTKPDRGTASEQLALSITKGQNEEGEDLDTMMPRWSSLSKTQVDSLIQYLQTANGAPPELSSAAKDLKGEQLYQAACSACHGQDRAGLELEQGGQAVSVPSLQWDELSKMYQTKPERGTVAEQLVLSITKAQNEEGEDLDPLMPRWSILSKVQVDSLIQYLQTATK